MELTVGFLEDKLRKFSKGTPIRVNCKCCYHGTAGDETIISIDDRTDQTYGYIELNLNDSTKAQVELAKDKELFYQKEIEKLTKIIKQQQDKIAHFKGYAENIKRNVDIILK